MKPAKNIERIVKENKLDLKTTSEMDQWILDGLAKGHNKQQIKFSDDNCVRRKKWSIIMQKNYVKFTSAAVILLCVFIGMYLSNDSIDIATPAFADVFSNVQQAKTVVYTKDFYKDNGKAVKFSTKNSVMEGGLLRIDMAHGDISIFDNINGVHVQVLPAGKMAIRTKTEGNKENTKVFDQLGWIVNLHKEDAEHKGQEEIGGKKVDVFYINRHNIETTIWVDPANNLPVKVKRVRHKTVGACRLQLDSVAFGDAPEDGVTRSWSAGNSNAKDVTVMKDFKWNVKLDSQLFSTEMPDDYKVTESKKQQNISKPGWEYLTESFEFFQKNNGKLPAKIEDLVNQDIISPILVKAFDGDDEPKEELNKAMTKMRVLMNGYRYVSHINESSEVHYVGGSIDKIDAKTAVCWWKRSGSDEYRVIYGDMSVKLVPAKEFEKALAK